MRDKSALSSLRRVIPAVESVCVRNCLLLDYLRSVGKFERIFLVSNELRSNEQRRSVFVIEFYRMVDLYLEIYRVYRHITGNVEPICVVPTLEYVSRRSGGRFLSLFGGRLFRTCAVLYFLHARLAVAVDESHRIFVDRRVINRAEHCISLHGIGHIRCRSVFFCPMRKSVGILRR